MEKFSELNPKVVLCIAAHPDDLEFGVSGSVAVWVAAGAVVHYLICTDGSKGSDDEHISSAELIKIRRDEQRAAGEILGLSSVNFLDYEDGITEASPALKRDIARVIRQLKPDTVVAPDPKFLYSAEFGVVNHNDHRVVGVAAMDAVYPLARDHLSFPELLVEGHRPHKVKHLLFSGMFEDCNYYVDISATFDTKLTALGAHKSQVDVDAVREWLSDLNAKSGEKAGYGKAEGFVRLDMFI